MHKAQKQPDDWIRGETIKGQGSGGLFRVTGLGTRCSSQIRLFSAWKRECSFSGLGQWKSVGCGVRWRWLRVCVGAACRCLQVQLKVAEPRHMAFPAEESGFVSGVKAPLVPHWDDLQKALCVCVCGGGQLAQVSALTKAACRKSHPPWGPEWSLRGYPLTFDVYLRASKHHADCEECGEE